MKFGRNKADNRGLSLVELVCAVAILAVIGLMISGVIVTSSRNYVSGTSEVEVQQEAQILVNQIADLVLDATKPVTWNADVLTVIQQDYTYEVSYVGERSEVLCSQYYTVDYPSRTALIAENQVLAEDVTSFDMDVSEYTVNGRVSFDVAFMKSGRSFGSQYVVTARNGKVSVSEEDDGQVNLFIDQGEIVLEPNQSYTLPEAVVTGTTKTGVVWKLSGNKSTSTVLTKAGDSWILKVGKDETAASLTLLVQTNAKKKDKVTPAAQVTVRVYIRRVTGITLTGNLESGRAMCNGAVYYISAQIQGTNLERRSTLASDADYIRPTDINWKCLFTSNGSEVWNSAWYYEVLNQNSNGDYGCYIRVRLKTDLGSSNQLLITATSAHASGGNKTHTQYDNIYDHYWLHSNYWTFNGGNVYRGSDQSQGSFNAFDALKSQMVAKYGNADYKPAKRHRYREVLSIDEATGERTYGPWTTWRDNPQNQEDIDINLRPVVTLSFSCERVYEIQIELRIINKWNGMTVWPDESVPVEAYTIDAEVSRAKVAMNSSGPVWFTNAFSGGSAESPMVISKGSQDVRGTMYYSYAEGIKLDNIRDRIIYVVEKYNPETGTWKTAANSEAQIDRQGSQCDYRFKKKGDYRIMLTAENVLRYVYASGSYREASKNYKLYDVDSGLGIFYFRIN